MISFFANKGIKDFKNSKLFWKFYSASIRIKSGNFNSVLPSVICDGEDLASDPSSICDMFNSFFTKISSDSLSCNSECKEFINDQFLELKRANAFKTDTFNFQHTSVDKVEKLLASIDSTSSAGLAGIPTKTLVSNAKFLAPMFTKFFNNCIDSSILPDDFKAACVTPLFKNKGKNDDVNNYRGISVLIPVAKVLEKILGEQIVSYFSRNLLFFDEQHGFRAYHSCETSARNFE